MDTAIQAQIVQAALKVLDAYVQRVQPNWTSSLLYQVVRLTLEKLHDPALAEAEAQQLAERVISEYHLQNVSGLSQEKAETIAAQVADEIAQFQEKQAAVLRRVDVSQPQVGDDLSLSSPIQRTPIADANA